MKAEFLNPFIASVVNVIENLTGERPNKGKVYLRDKYPYTADNIVIVVGITGELQGQFVLTMSEKSSLAIASKMMMEDVKILDDVAQSALAEMANMITGNSTIQLAEIGYNCDITPPSIIKGKQIEISCQDSIKTIVIPLDMDSGHIDVNLAIVEAPSSHSMSITRK